MPDTFKFKQFSVTHDKCAMKVNTDGVLLGAWAEVDDTRSILDIGTGTGVIALMLAQRNSVAMIDAIDIDEQAYMQAKENFEQSPWRERLTAIHSPLQHFPLQNKYDTIISNPPYFIDDYKTPHLQKNVARHSVALSYRELLWGISKLLSQKGKAFLVIPCFNYDTVEDICQKEKLFITRVTQVTAIEGKKPYLVLLQLEKDATPVLKKQLTIQHASGKFTDEYKLLTKEFYLKF